MHDYKWEETDKIKQLQIELEALKLSFEMLKLSPKIEENFRRIALLKSSVFSVRIEGFSDTLASPKAESQRLVQGYKLVHFSKSPQNLTLKFIRQLHQITLDKLSYNAGHWRREAWGIFNPAGVAVYLAPAYFNVPELMSNYVSFINKIRDHTAVKASVAQFIFEKIHPFADGNGRVGRLISAHILAKSGYNFRGLAPFEEYIDKYRLDYYAALESSHDITNFVEFFLEALVFQSKEILAKLIQPPAELAEDDLPPRQLEILQIVKDHPYCSFDSIHRRFIGISPSTLRYDVTQLTKSGFIKKIRKTRGAMYVSQLSPGPSA
mgnify:CR=1 FL=1